MSQSFGCKCEIKDKKNWRVIHRNHNHSYFEYPKGQEEKRRSSSLCVARWTWKYYI